MKLRINLKDPDGFHDSVRMGVSEYIGNLQDKFTDNELEALRESRTEIVWDFLSKYTDYQEYISFDIDTEAGTIDVVKNGN